MTGDAQGLPWGVGAAALVVAVWAGWRDHRRRRRVDPDAVGWVDWTLVQVVALIAATVSLWVAWRG